MMPIEQALREIQESGLMEIDFKQAQMIADIKKLNLPKPTYGIATSQEIFLAGLQQSRSFVSQTILKP